MPHASLPPLFSPRQQPSPYLACWHQAFAALAPEASFPVVMLFDREPHSPIRECLRLPATTDPHARRISLLYLAALGNNVLCTFGARKARLLAPKGGLDEAFVRDLERLLCTEGSPLTTTPFDFLLTLSKRLYQAPFSIELVEQAAAEPTPRPAQQPPKAKDFSPQTVFAVNIGQHLTRLAVVRFDATGGYALSRQRRMATWPDQGQPGFACLWDRTLAAMRETLAGEPVELDAVSLSVAATVVDGTILPVADIGLFGGTADHDLAGINERIRSDLATHFPGLPVNCINDAEAQAIFAFATCDREQEAPGKHFLALRLGACPCLRPLDAKGRVTPGLHEYGWLALKRNTQPLVPGLFTTTTPYLTHYGPARIARELSLLDRYGVDDTEAIAFFHDKLLTGTPGEHRDALRLYHVLGAHIAMLGFEIHRHAPLAAIALQGSCANAIDAPAFDAIRDGFYAFCLRHQLPLTHAALYCLEDTSALSGLVGAALAGLIH